MSEERLERIERKLDALADGVIRRFIRVDGSIATLGDKIDTVDRRVDTLDQKVTGLDQKVTGLDQKVDAGFAQVDARFTRIHAGIVALNHKTSRIEAKLDSIEKTQSNINLELSDGIDKHEHRESSQKLDDHEGRIVALEKG